MTTSFYRETVSRSKGRFPNPLHACGARRVIIAKFSAHRFNSLQPSQPKGHLHGLATAADDMDFGNLCAVSLGGPGAGSGHGRVAGQRRAGRRVLWVDSLDLSPIEQGFGQPQAGRSVDNQPIKIKGVSFVHGVGTHAASEMRIDLKDAATKFISQVGVDDETRGKGSVVFEVYVDGKKIASSGLMRGGEAPKTLSADLTGAKQLVLIVTDGGDTIDWDHADWAGAVLFVAPGATEKPQTFTIPDAPAPAIVHPESPLPAIHGPRITGSTPGRPFLS